MKAKRKSARDLYQQYGIQEPAGLLSEEQDSDLAHSGDGNQSPQIYCHICHVCFQRTDIPAQCLVCGHQFCPRCSCERPGVVAKVGTASSHRSSRFDNREFTQNDTSAKASEQAEQQENAEASTSTKHYDSRHTAEAERGLERYYDVKHKEQTLNASKTHSSKFRDARHHEISRDTYREHDAKQHKHSTQEQLDFKSISGKMDTVRGLTAETLNQNPFLIADRNASGKTFTTQSNKNAASCRFASLGLLC